MGHMGIWKGERPICIRTKTIKPFLYYRAILLVIAPSKLVSRIAEVVEPIIQEGFSEVVNQGLIFRWSSILLAMVEYFIEIPSHEPGEPRVSFEVR